MEGVTKTSVVIETSRYRIRGDVAVAPRNRLSDYANQPARDFFAITDAHIAPLEDISREIAVSFMLVARHEISLMLPSEASEKSRTDDAKRDEAAAHFWALMDR